jgi:hypothetical protein
MTLIVFQCVFDVLSVQRPSRSKAGLDEDRDEAEMAMVGGKKHSGVELGKTFYALEL